MNFLRTFCLVIVFLVYIIESIRLLFTATYVLFVATQMFGVVFDYPLALLLGSVSLLAGLFTTIGYLAYKKVNP